MLTTFAAHNQRRTLSWRTPAEWGLSHRVVHRLVVLITCHVVKAATPFGRPAQAIDCAMLPMDYPQGVAEGAMLRLLAQGSVGLGFWTGGSSAGQA